MSDPVMLSPEHVARALRLHVAAQLMGLVDGAKRFEPTLAAFRDVARALFEAGIGVEPALRLLEWDPGDEGAADVLRRLLDQLDDALAHSPYPEGEWPRIRALMGDELLGDVLGTSPSSLRRYGSGERETPDDVAWLLHVTARVIGDLLGSYNEYGVRRWFERPRSQLDGRAPRDLLREARDDAGTDDAAVQPVLDLAASLVAGQGAT